MMTRTQVETITAALRVAKASVEEIIAQRDRAKAEVIELKRENDRLRKLLEQATAASSAAVAVKTDALDRFNKLEID